MYEIVSSFNETTKLVMNDGRVFVAKKITPEDIELYHKLSKIDSEYVAKIIGTALIENDFYAIEEFVQGVTLEKYFQQHGLLDDDEVERIITQLCYGLEAIHSVGVVHRDITPNNIMIDDNDKVRIIDFGISRIKKVNQSADTQLLGTQGFASPEQYGFGQTGFESDVYSIGVLINYLHTGLYPNQKICSGRHSSVVLKCTQMDKNLRYQNTADIVADIRKKGRNSKIIHAIPGFRKDVWWHMLIAILYYVTAILMIALRTEGLTWRQEIGSDIGFFLMILAPVPILLNMCNWADRFELTRNKTKSTRIFIQFLIAGIVFLIGAVMFSIIGQE